MWDVIYRSVSKGARERRETYAEEDMAQARAKELRMMTRRGSDTPLYRDVTVTPNLFEMPEGERQARLF
jgi:hypothetical protein